MIEMHLFDNDAREEKALCGAETSADCRRSVSGYLEHRLNDADVGTICEGCKLLAPRFAMTLAQDLVDEGLLDEAVMYRDLSEGLLRETGRNVSGV